MHQIGEIHIRLEHVSLVGPVHAQHATGKWIFDIVLNGNEVPMKINFKSAESAEAAHASLLQALAVTS